LPIFYDLTAQQIHQVVETVAAAVNEVIQTK
jgi:hypothetical protein